MLHGSAQTWGGLFRNPGQSTLMLKTLVEMYNRLMFVSKIVLDDEDERRREHLLLVESREKVLRQVGTIPKDLKERTEKQMG